MFSFKELNPKSRTIGIIRDKEKKSPAQVLYFTERSRDLNLKENNFDEKFEKYGERDRKGFYKLDSSKYSFEMAPHSKVTQEYPRFVNYMIAKSNSGKSYQIALMVKKYLEVFPNNNVFYASANPLENDISYKSILKDKLERVKEIDIMSLTTVMDFKEIKDTLVIFDDCDTLMTTTLEDLDERLTEENVKQLSVVDKTKAHKMLKNKSHDCLYFLNQSIKSLLNCGRKNNISVINISHKYNDGTEQMRMISEATGVILFPYTTTSSIFSTFLKNKLSFDKDQVKLITDNIEFFQYDYFYVNNSGSMFIMTPDTLKIFK